MLAKEHGEYWIVISQSFFLLYYSCNNVNAVYLLVFIIK
ncbi:hypothetical protein T4D_7762 [Trichinella pseudospiralis]|uniref:Uncharacterized protein n=1 Tax=Trichinella pseudospiralis TaxID=6337 RepID=A0A0V1DRA3_TRIPS|nr:hypothetical protein T4D_7762 [Trichinella pseudospiralis]